MSNTHTSATIQCSPCEPLFLAPFYWGQGETTGFFGLSQLDINIQCADLTQCWSHNNGNVISTITPTFFSTPTLLITTVTPNELIAPYINTKEYIYPYFEIVRYVTPYGSVTAGSSATVTSNAIALQSIPKRIYLVVKQTNSAKTYLSSDSFASISNVNITWNNRVGLQANASQQQLYNMDVRNGYNDSYQAWSNFNGSVHCVDLATDIGFDVLESASLATQNILQVTVTFSNPSLSTINYDFYIICHFDGSAVIYGNQMITRTGIVSKSDVLNAKLLQDVTYNSLDSTYGSGRFSGVKSAFWSGLKSLGNAGLSALKKHGPDLARSVVENLVASRGKGVSGIGLPNSSGGRRRRSSLKKRGRGLSDVKVLTRNQMKEKVDSYSSDDDSDW